MVAPWGRGEVTGAGGDEAFPPPSLKLAVYLPGTSCGAAGGRSSPPQRASPAPASALAPEAAECSGAQPRACEHCFGRRPPAPYRCRRRRRRRPSGPRRRLPDGGGGEGGGSSGGSSRGRQRSRNVGLGGGPLLKRSS